MSILDVNGPLVTVRLPDVSIGEQVRVGELGLVGEVIARDGDRTVLQVYESTEGVRPGEAAVALGYPLSVELGPGLLSNIFDGVQRPLAAVAERCGDHVGRGLDIPALARDREWPFVPDPELAADASIGGGRVLGTVQETPQFAHRILVPPLVHGTLVDLATTGNYRLEDVIARVRRDDGEIVPLTLFHRWPVRVPRPYVRRDHAGDPLITGQRILDTFFPLMKGGKGAIPGPFGAGKTVLQSQIARWSNTQVVIYVGCGERGNELTDILETLPQITDPYTGRPLMERTIVVANTSNMPVVAREASIYVGITLAEYFRDQGCDVVMVADSTSRWAEALREVAGRLQQMPVEEGYPAYLASRLAAFYERAGRVATLSGHTGSVTLIGAVSPPGGDFSEPVTSHTKEIIQTFWALSKHLADARHYPSVDWNESFSGDVADASRWWSENASPQWAQRRGEALALLSQAEELARIVNLVGMEALSDRQRWALESAALIREAVLQQSALDETDSFCSPLRQFLLLDLVLEIHRQGESMISAGVPAARLISLPLLPKARRYKTNFGNHETDKLAAARNEITATFDRLRAEYAQTGKAVAIEE